MANDLNKSNVVPRNTCTGLGLALEFADSTSLARFNMQGNGIGYSERQKKDKAKRAIGLAMQSRWEEAVTLNMTIIADFSADLETYNRLGKALSELGRNREARDAFKNSLTVSPNNNIAKRNLLRLSQLEDNDPLHLVGNVALPQEFIEETGKTGVTSLINLGPPMVLLKLAAGHGVPLDLKGSKIIVTDSSNEYVGQIEPKLGTRLSKLMSGGNKYEAVTTSVAEDELTILIREVYKHPSQMNILSFPFKSNDNYKVRSPEKFVELDLSDDEVVDRKKNRIAAKDWSNDDTEPGDDEAFTPAIHRIIRPDDETSDESEDTF